MKRIIIVLFSGMLLFPSHSFARLQVGGGVALAWPQGEFEEQVDFAIGLSGRGGWSSDGLSPVAVTPFLDLNYLDYGYLQRIEPFSTTIPDVFVDVVTENYMFLISPGISVGATRGPVRPYGEVFGGLTFIATHTKIANRDHENIELFVAESTNLSDFTYNIGIGGGVKIRVWQKNTEKESLELREALVDIRLSYIKGGEAEYLKKGSIRRNGTQVIYDSYRSSTNMKRLTIGIAIIF